MNALYILVSSVCFHTINAPIYQQVAGRSSDVVGENVCIQAVTRTSGFPILALNGETAYCIVPEKK